MPTERPVIVTLNRIDCVTVGATVPLVVLACSHVTFCGVVTVNGIGLLLALVNETLCDGGLLPLTTDE